MPTQVEKAPTGWTAIVSVADGATVSRVFDSEEDARRYGADLAQWLSQRREE